MGTAIVTDKQVTDHAVMLLPIPVGRTVVPA